MKLAKFGPVLGLLAALPAVADTEFTADVGIESRLFLEEPLYDGQEDHNASLSLSAEWAWYQGDHAVVVKPFARLDSADDERTHADLREAYWHYLADRWELRVGLYKVFWGVTESRHLVDVINQTDLVEDLDGEEKLGQPMIQWSTLQDWGTVEVFLLPYFRERTFPGEEGRLRTPLPVATDEARYEHDDEQSHLDVALRYRHYLGPMDIGLHYFEGTNRDPYLSPDFVDGELVLVPEYDQIRQFGLDLQITKGSWLWKLEALHRSGERNALGEEEDYQALVAGLEYTFFGITDGNKDLGVLVEYLGDSRGDESGSAFQNDVFLGARLAFNDIADTSMLAGAIHDLDHGATTWRLEAERRFGDTWTGKLELNLFTNPQVEDPLYSLRDDDFLRIQAVKYF